MTVAVPEGRAPQAGPLNGRASLVERLFAPIDIASLVVFRIAFGAIMTWEALRYLVPRVPDGVSWARQFYIDPPILFKYYGFSWVHPWPGDGMIYHFWAWAIAALCVTFGVCYRFSATVLFLLVTHVFLLDQTRYLNHLYFICLLCFLLIFLPLNRSMSLDAKPRPSIRSESVPAWTLYLLRFQMALVYVFSGIARANGDWMRGEPMRTWLRSVGEGSALGSIAISEWAPYFFSYGGMLFDLLIVPLLLWRRTRPAAFCVAVLFHLSNAYLFYIGVFPWLGIAATTLFLESAWPRGFSLFARRAARLGNRPEDRPAQLETGAPREVEPAGPPADFSRSSDDARRPFPIRRSVVAMLAVYAIVQLLVPLRHWLYPGSVNWTNEGHNFSWRMKLDDRRTRVRLEVVNPATGARTRVKLDDFLTGRQQHVMSTRPDMLVQFAHHVADHYHREFGTSARPQVYADIELSLNGRPMKQLIDSTVDLASRRVSMRPADWIVRQELEPLNVSDGADARRLGE